MSLLNNILSSIDPTAAKEFTTQPTRLTPNTNTPKSVQRQPPGINGIPQNQPLKRKAEGQPDGGQAKLQRKNVSVPPNRAILPTRAAPTPGDSKPKAATPSSAVPSSSVPYRGTVGNGGQGASRPVGTIAKKHSPVARQPSTVTKPAAPPISKPPTVTSASGAVPKKLGYAALLQQAKQKDMSKPTAPPIKHETPKFLSKKQLEKIKAQEKAASKGKKPVMTGPGKTKDVKREVNVEKRKPADLGYQGTARPAKKPVDVGYKGTARPASTPASAVGNAARPTAAKSKPRVVGQGRYGGYASWSDDDMEDDEEEEEFDSDGSSDMEANPWDMENEEEEALKAAKLEDALALKEENEHKKKKAALKQKLAAMAKAAGQKKKF